MNGDTKPWLDALKSKRIKALCSVSAASHQGTDELLKMVLPIVLEEREKQATPSEESAHELPVLRPAEDSEKMGAFTVSRDAGVITVQIGRAHV